MTFLNSSLSGVGSFFVLPTSGRLSSHVGSFFFSRWEEWGPRSEELSQRRKKNDPTPDLLGVAPCSPDGSRVSVIRPDRIWIHLLSNHGAYYVVQIGPLHANYISSHTRGSRAYAQTDSRRYTSVYTHGLAGSADSNISYVIPSQGKMVDAMVFSVRWAQRPLQSHSILWWHWLCGSRQLIADPANPWFIP
jgi:hypothetical protein